MSRVVFRNYDEDAIKELFHEAGKERMRAAIKDSGMPNTPISMKGFYLEYEMDTGAIKAYFRYPSNVTFFILPVLGYWRVPSKGWEMERLD
ncbi:hypothetical protein [Ulvibacterium sp.]|uniref:hypothetical protein n=1 Tax=Ulvibacterium sp. TaxID=2665914 RepID=UPI00260BDCF5|nr:hypothetical protein [Ulvibacterium sp.]